MKRLLPAIFMKQTAQPTSNNFPAYMDPHLQLPLKRLTALVCLVLFFACNTATQQAIVDPAYSRYVSAYTSGVVSKKNTIRIQLAADAQVTHTLNTPVDMTLFELKPSVPGTTVWTDERTLEFRPAKDLKPGQQYQVTFHLGRVMQTEQAYKDMVFSIEAIAPDFEVESFGLRSTGKNTMRLSGQLVTADVESSAAVEQLLQATYGGSKLTLSWQHNETMKTHQFTIDPINRGATDATLQLSWNGDALGMKAFKGSKDIMVPATGHFTVLDVRAVQDEEQYALVQFSDLLQATQQLEGLISISNQEGLSYTILGSEVKLYTTERLDGNYTINIVEGIENQWGAKLPAAFTSNVFFDNRLPSVSIPGRGSILPTSTGKLVLPFDAINLNAVDVSIIKIYENNVARFLQDNGLNDGNGLRQVGKPVVETTVRLDNDQGLNLRRKNRFSLDLDKYIRAEPGAIYRVFIGFRPEYSLYECRAAAPDEEAEDDVYDYEAYVDNIDDDGQFWSRYDDYYPYGYSWQHRDNPCHPSYYNKERFAGRNILASNIGLIAKRTGNNSLFVAANDLVSASPMDNVELQVLDYQQQVIAKSSTNNDGFATIALGRKPWLLVAKKGTEKGYLKLDDGSSLPLGRFDVAGAEVRNGIKAFLFGERGVWRPGDSIYLSCMVDDTDNKLPEDHPVTLELFSPRGQLYKRMVQPLSDERFNVFRLASAADAPTGNWLCKVKIGGAVFEKKLKIETVMPNRLKIDLDFGNTAMLGKNASVNGTLTARWLFGATAQNLKARVDAQLYKKTTSFPKFSGYVFDNPTVYFSPQSATIFDGTLNSTGTANISPAFETGEQAPGQLLANLMVKVFEPGGNFSIDNIALPYNPYTSYVGVKVPEGDKTWGFLQSGKTHQLQVADVDTRGEPVPGQTRIEVQLYRIQWRWWWDNTGDDLSNFTQDEYNKLVKKDTITLSNGKGVYDIRIGEGNWGRYLILLKDTRSGHSTGSTFYIDDYGWQARGDAGDPSAAAMLSFTADKEKYNVGEKVTLTIPSSKGGTALISLESGSTILETHRVETTQRQTTFSFTADKTMSPNLYVNVSLLQPHAQTVNDLPIRMYGVLPIMVEDKNTVLKPVIKMPDVIRPEEKTSITVAEATGRRMTYVIAVVDEGLLDLTRFKTPDPHTAFYAKEALGVKSWDLYDDVIGAWGGSLQRILTIGGDAEAELASKTRRANRFKPVVQFLGPFTTSGKGTTHSFTLPPYMGSVRTMVIAAGDNACGFAEKAVQVKKPLMLLATLPRVLGPGEELKIPVTVFATDPSIRSVSVQLQSNPFLQAGGAQTIPINGSGEQLVYFTAKVNNTTGVGKVKITATSGSLTATTETELDIRNPNPPVTQVVSAVLQPGQSMNQQVSMIGDAAGAQAVVELSSIPPINLQKRLQYLITYPHGCIEQTVSALFPQLVLHQFMELSEAQTKKIDANIRAGIQKLLNFQQPDGGFSYWPGSSTSDEWGSSYAGHFLLEAQARGYSVPTAMLQSWKVYEHTKAVAWNMTSAPWYGSYLQQAYRLYLLALVKAPETGAMNRLKEFKFLTPEARWRLAAAYHLTGQTQVALGLISGLPTSFPPRPDPGMSFGSDLRDQAMVLETLTIMNRRAEATPLIQATAAKLSQESWYSTQTTAWALLAMAKATGSNPDQKKIIVTGKAGTQQVNMSTASVMAQLNPGWQNGKTTVQLANKGGTVVYVRIINQGQPFSTDSMPALSNNDLRMTVQTLGMNGQPVDAASLRQGTDFVAKVTVTNPGNRGAYTQLALTQIFPSGWEILNTRLYNSEGAFQSAPSDYMDIRDDRVYQYFNLQPGESRTYYVQLNAAYPGRFYWPGVYAEAMYDHTISAGVRGRWVAVRE